MAAVSQQLEQGEGGEKRISGWGPPVLCAQFARAEFSSNQTHRVHERTDALAVGSRGQPGKSGQGFQTGCFHCCEEEERRAGWKGPSREVPSDGRCLDMGSRSTSFQSGFLLTDWAGDAWTVGAGWRVGVVGRMLFVLAVTAWTY